MSPLLRAATPPSTIRLLAYMAGAGILSGAILYVAFVIGVCRVTPEPIHPAISATSFHFKGAV